MIGGLLAGCQDQAEVEMKGQIKFEPNEEYTGDPHPNVEEKMKLTETEQKEYEQIKQDILSQKEGK
jgi:hypothetical protein